MTDKIYEYELVTVHNLLLTLATYSLSLDCYNSSFRDIKRI